MASPEVFDFAQLVAPIAGENPAGVSLRDDFSPTSIYHAIKDARAAARAAERAVAWGDEEESQDNRADWRPVLEEAPKVIAQKSKDLEIAAWLTEALIRKHGYAGLRDGFRLARELIERFWDNLYPLPDEDGVITRVAPLTGLNGDESDGVLITPIANVPITAGTTYAPFTLSDYKQAVELDQLGDPDKRAQRIEQGAVSMQMFDTAVAETSPDFFRNLLDDIEQCSEEFQNLCNVLEEKCGKGEDGYSLAPPSSNIRNALKSCHEDVRNVCKHLLVDDTAEEMIGGEDGGAIIPVEGQAGQAVSQVRTRNDAFRALLQVAEFFKRTEPHSPVSYALEQAVRWGKMPLPDLLSELVPEKATREQIFKLVGIKPPEES